MHLLEQDCKAGCLEHCFAEKSESRRKRGFIWGGGVSGAPASVADSFVPFRFFRLPALIGMANQAVQRTGASRHAEWRCRRCRWLAPVADLRVRYAQQTKSHSG
jgi:hypothetical protein